MLASQIYYEFAKEVERMKSNMVTTNSSVYRDTQVLTKQLTQMRVSIEMRNKEIDRQLSDLKRMIILLSERR